MSCNVISERTVITRKEHICFACFRRFPIGSKMVYQANTIDGDFCSVYMCETCKALTIKEYKSLYDDFDGLFQEGCVSGALHENGYKTPEEWLNAKAVQ